MDQDPFKTPYVVPDMAVVTPALIARMGPDYQNFILSAGFDLAEPERQTCAYRTLGPATEGDGEGNEGIFVYKGLGERRNKIHNRANEVGAMRHAARWYTEGRHKHAHVPEVWASYTDFPRDGTAPTRDVYLCMENLQGTHYRAHFHTDGCTGWTVREKRRFVRQMALIRLSMIHMRANRICGLAEDGSFSLMVHHGINFRRIRGRGGMALRGVIDPQYYANLDPVVSEEAWTQQGIRREMDYWTNDFNAVKLRRLMVRHKSVFSWTVDGFRQHVRHHAAAARGRKFRKPWQELDEPNADYPYCFDHGDLHDGFNIQCYRYSPRIRGIIDWELAMFLPYSFAVRDINAADKGIGKWNEELRMLRGADMPFEADMYWNHRIAFWQRESRWRQQTRRRREQRTRRKNRPMSTMNDNNYAAYGTLTPRDLIFGDTLDEEATGEEPPDDPDPFYFGGKREYVSGTSHEMVQPGTWFYEPVMKLVDEYLQAEMNISPLCKYLDPYAYEWCMDYNRMIVPP